MTSKAMDKGRLRSTAIFLPLKLQPTCRPKARTLIGRGTRGAGNVECLFFSRSAETVVSSGASPSVLLLLPASLYTVTKPVDGEDCSVWDVLELLWLFGAGSLGSCSGFSTCRVVSWPLSHVQLGWLPITVFTGQREGGREENQTERAIRRKRENCMCVG